MNNALICHPISPSPTFSDSSEVRVLSRDEEKQDALRNDLRDDRVRYFIGDIRDRGAVDRAIVGMDAVLECPH